MDDRTEIEERLAHLLAAVDDLSDTVARQEGEIARLTRRVEMLLARIRPGRVRPAGRRTTAALVMRRRPGRRAPAPPAGGAPPGTDGSASRPLPPAGPRA